MPQPIDPTTEINRTMAVERIQQLATRADLAAQSRQATELAKQQQAMETEVDRPDAKSDEVDRDLKRRNPYSGRRKKRQPAPAPPPTQETRTFYNAHERPAIVEDDQHHGLDITI